MSNNIGQLSSSDRICKAITTGSTRVTRDKRPQSRHLTASLFINTHEIMKKKRKYLDRTSCGRRGGVEREVVLKTITTLRAGLSPIGTSTNCASTKLTLHAPRKQPRACLKCCD
eukprot:1150310-Pelagomonas_calceolata.AAC.1